jgi:hypothetical protein
MQRYCAKEFAVLTKAKCRHLKKLTCNGTFRQVLIIRVYRLEIQSVILVFSTQLCELLPH